MGNHPYVTFEDVSRIPTCKQSISLCTDLIISRDMHKISRGAVRTAQL